VYAGLKITPPFFEIGPKAYLYGKDALKLAQYADRMSRKYNVQIIFTPQYVDIWNIAHHTRSLLVFAQHMDSLEIGRGIGSVLPEAVKTAGAVGVLLNHSEKRLTMDELAVTIKRADQVGLASMVCADHLEDTKVIARMNPNIIIVESPELIGVGKRAVGDKELIARTNQMIHQINSDILILHGAGISTGKDVYDIIAAGSQASGSTSGILNASDPFAVLEEMIRSVRQAWNDTH
jgi:triosephosphate isomerase